MITATVIGSLESAARDSLSYLDDKVSAVPTAGWVVFVIGLLALSWAWAIMHASTRLGPITVDDVQHDAAAGQIALQALTAAFRQRLWRVGLAPPPVVPEGAPQANLITAIEGTSPQGTAIGKVLELLPTPPGPPTFKVTATLTGLEPKTSVPSAGATGSNPCGVIFTLQPLDRGAPYVHTIQSRPTHLEALDLAAVDIYRQIARELPDVFPIWVRWRTGRALRSYMDGLESRSRGDLTQAATQLKAAAEQSPFNALAALQLGNLNETFAGFASDAWHRAYFQAQALKIYRATGVLWPSLVETRYRASIVASGLATSYSQFKPEATPGGPNADQIVSDRRHVIQALVPLPGPESSGANTVVKQWVADDAYDEYVDRLRRFAARESSATVQLLKPLYTLTRERRLRNQFESKGRTRRELRASVRISRNCVRVRKLNQFPATFLLRVEVRYRTVRVLVNGWSFTDATWQSRYNMACFDALRLAGPFVDRTKPSRVARIERRALRNLDLAIREPSSELTASLVRNDPDMEYFSRDPA